MVVLVDWDENVLVVVLILIAWMVLFIFDRSHKLLPVQNKKTQPRV
jgi:hypothetical protein